MPLCPWDFPGKNTGVGCHSFLQGIFPIQRLNPHLLYLLHCQVDYYPIWIAWEELQSQTRQRKRVLKLRGWWAGGILRSLIHFFSEGKKIRFIHRQIHTMMRKVQKLSGDLSHTATLTIPWSTYCNLEEPRHGDSCGISLALFKKKKKISQQTSFRTD